MTEARFRSDIAVSHARPFPWLVLPGAGRPGPVRRVRLTSDLKRHDREQTGGATAKPHDLEDRIAAHAARVAAGDPGDEARLVYCWGPCGGRLAHPRQMIAAGWFTRPVDLGGGEPEVETLCPACFAAWGFIEPRGA